MHIARVYRAIMALHYVDDTGAARWQGITQRRREVCGEAQFLQYSGIRHLGRTALRPLYFRAYAIGCPRGAPLTRAISAALDSIEFNMNFAPPRIIPFAVHDRRRACAYAVATSRSAAK
jgi:hypothetical protein